MTTNTKPKTGARALELEITRKLNAVQNFCHGVYDFKNRKYNEASRRIPLAIIISKTAQLTVTSRERQMSLLISSFDP